jgi:hypothetical protein
MAPTTAMQPPNPNNTVTGSFVPFWLHGMPAPGMAPIAQLSISPEALTISPLALHQPPQAYASLSYAHARHDQVMTASVTEPNAAMGETGEIGAATPSSSVRLYPCEGKCGHANWYVPNSIESSSSVLHACTSTSDHLAPCTSTPATPPYAI